MANYKELEGFGVQTLAADPDNTSWIGSIFYNSTEGVFKTVKPGGAPIGTWSSGGNLNTGRFQLGGFGVQTSAVMAGGDTGTLVTNAESYDGSSWTNIASINTPRQMGAGAGITNTSGIGFGGLKTPLNTGASETESWNGSAWTELNDLNTGRFTPAGDGITTAAICAGGSEGPGDTPRAYTEIWNGTSWTEVNDLNTARRGLGCTGTSTDALAYAGQSPVSNVGFTETWNGTSWTEVADMNTDRYLIGGAGSSSTYGIAFAGETPPATAATESFDGTSWTEVADMATATQRVGSTGTQGAALAVGGQFPSYSTATEEWNAPDVVINTLTTS